MLIVISPAKTLDYETPAVTTQYSQPDFLPQSQQLIDQLQALTPADIAGLMKISDKLGQLNYARFQEWQLPFSPDNAKQALLAFKGDVYSGIEASSFSEADFDFAQQHLRMLSGLYGLLRPLDLMRPYRLEMGTKFANAAGKNLYEFWGEQLTDALNSQFQQLGSQLLVNLASNEYFKAVQAKQLQAEVISPVFKDLKGGKYKVISFYAKKARGLMTAYIIKNRLSDAEQLKAFDLEGYRYNAAMSTVTEPTFIRDHAE